jgi:UDP-glucose 4-epimerase
MRIAVTGGAGFIGGHVVDELIARGHDPLVFDHMGRGHRDDVLVMLGDTRDDTAVAELAAHAEGVIHLASVLGTQETVHNPRPAVTTNVVSGLNVFEACVQYGLPCVNIAVGNAGMANPYSASKTCVETLGQMYVRDRGLRLNQVRAVNAYGPRQAMAAPYGPGKVRKIMPAFVARALTGADVEIYGDGHQVSDMVHVRDVARTLVNALEYAAKGEIVPLVEVGPVEHHTVNQVATAVIRATGPYRTDIPLDDASSYVRHLPMRPGETPGAYVVADTSTLPAVGIDPAELIPLERGVTETVAWYSEHWLPSWMKQQPLDAT